MKAERVAGVDEAGRGPLAGPVVVAAVILDPSRPIGGLADSKKLTSMDLVEINPILDVANKTAGLAVELTLSALGKSIL